MDLRTFKSALRRDRNGSGALEFAVVAIPFVLFLMFLLELGFDFFAQVALDYGVQTAARQIQIGNAQGAGSAAIFQANYLCPALSGLLTCSSVTVSAKPITTDYFTAVSAKLPTDANGQLNTTGFNYCPGKPNQLMLVQAVYTSPSLVYSLIPGMATASASGFVRVTLSSTAFINENFPVTAASPAGC